MPLDQQQIDFFSANGYLSCGQIISGNELELLRAEYDRLFKETSGTNLSGDQSGQRMLQILGVHKCSPLFARLTYDARILDVVADIMGPSIQLFHDQALFKPAHTGGPVLWHQDNAYWHCRPASLVSCWLTLDDVTRENGAMQVIPGSHLKPIWHAPNKDALLIDSSGQFDQSQAVTIDLPAGGCMFHHCQTLHYTQPNTTPNQRRAYAIHMMVPGTKQTIKGEKTFPVSFDHPILRLGL
jgi:ectoine hydroxylase-related dioxygenase (phytanoyl-CoA dioxygenase family)